MGLRNFASKIGKAAWKHKGLALRGVQLHPAAQMVLQVKNLKADDMTEVAGDILANIIAEISDDNPEKSEAWVALIAIERLLDGVVNKTRIDNQEMADALNHLAIQFRNKG